jgi:predicted nuclease with TOPRIM domain
LREINDEIEELEFAKSQIEEQLEKLEDERNQLEGNNIIIGDFRK